MKQKPVAPPPASAPGPWSPAAVVARVVVGLVLALSGIHKAAAPTAEFAAVVGGYYLLPNDWVWPFAAVLPWIEAFAGAALAAGYLTRPACAAAAGLFLMFIGALASALLRAIPLENCGCFGEGIHLTPLQGICLDSCLLVAAVFVLKRKSRLPAALDNWIDQGTI